ncbi:MAG: porin [Spongiibacteraceae bacterium]
MKRKLLTAVIASLTIGATSSALAGFPTVYGKVNVTLNKYDLEKLSAATGAGVVDELDNWSLESNASRIGIRGDFDITSDLKAIYKLEYGIDVDNGSGSNSREFNQRNIYGGFQGSWGTLFAGKNDSPLKLIQTNTVTQSDIDRFNDMPLADIGTYLVGENRPDNVIQYASPILLGGFEIAIAAIQGEETGVPVSATNKQDDDGFASGKSIALTYGKSSWYTAIAYDDNVALADTLRAVGEVTLGPVKIGAIYQTSEKHENVDVIGPFSTFIGSQNSPNPISEWDGSGAVANSFKEQEGYVINAAWKVAGPWTVKGQFGHSDTTPQQQPIATGVKYKDVAVDAIAAGVDYKLNDNAKLFAYYASVDTEGDNLVSTKSTQDKTYAVGFDLKF